MKNILSIAILLFFFNNSRAQISANLMQHPDVSGDKITFVYGDDIWVADKKSGLAHRLSSPEGREFYPRFSPDGKYIAYSANYDGNYDVYLIPSDGGIPKRLTYHDMYDRVVSWNPDGKSLIFASSRESGRQRFTQFFSISIEGGSPQKLAVPYGSYASISPDASKIAYTDRSRANRNWKRYRGGTAPDIHIFDLNTFETQNITQNDANDELPMWIGNSVYYMSDNGPEQRNNIWKYDIQNKKNEQITKISDYDITFPEAGDNQIIYEAGGKLFILNLENNQSEEVRINLISDRAALIPRQKNVSKYIHSSTISPDGQRVVIEARGDLFDLPAEKGYVSNLSMGSKAAERYPAWSPDGKSLAYWSDESGEYQMVIKDMAAKGSTKTITQFKEGFRYNIFWSPDSKKIAFVDQSMRLNLMEVSTGKITSFDKGKYLLEGGLRSFRFDWSPDSKWLCYTKSAESSATSAIFLYNTETNKVSQLTSGFYSDSNPVFSKDGKYLFFGTNRSFNPLYSDLDNSWIYPNTTGIAVGTLDENAESLLAIKNDEVSLEKEEEDTDKKSKKDKKDKSEGGSTDTKVSISNFENRVEMLDIEAGNVGGLTALDGKLLFMRYPNSGSPKEEKNALNYYDTEEEKVKTIISDINGYEVSADGKKILLSQKQNYAVISVASDQKIEKTVPIQKMVMEIDPRAEWKQIFMDVWRIERDYFYDPNMHGVDWNAMKEKYGKLVDEANSRADVNIIIGDLIAELNASHTYVGGGDTENGDNKNCGYLGADFSVENGYFKIVKIINGAPWDVELRSPLNKPGVNVKEGDYILEINGQKPDISKSIHAAFQGMADETVQLTINSKPSLDNSKKVLATTMKSETRLRHLAWIEANRKRVDEASNGKVGYIYVRSTGIDGQNELVRQYFGQMGKEGLIIDERFNSGGQIPDRFIELLDRKPLAFWAVRDGEDWSWPPAGNFGPKVMLINGFSGSGGDAFPDYFRKRKLGPLVGTRTWGGLIGISGAPTLVDNGFISSPTFRMYDPDGQWFREGHGVDPDIEVIEDFEQLAKGKDVQLEAGIKEVMRLMELESNFKKPARPAYEKR
ncbi:MAG: PDZ domain-containing protein [Cytophagales bacterium]